MKKWLIVLVTLMSVCIQPTVSANTYTELNINEGDITISQDGNYHIKGAAHQTYHHIVVKKDVNANIRLENVNISFETSASSGASAFLIEDDSTGNVNIEIIGNNVLKGNSAALLKNGDSENIGKLTIGGTGTLHAENTDTIGGAGIGSSKQKNTRNIIIAGGKITAIAGTRGSVSAIAMKGFKIGTVYTDMIMSAFFHIFTGRGI